MNSRFPIRTRTLRVLSALALLAAPALLVPHALTAHEPTAGDTGALLGSGKASYYRHGARTANGEAFDPSGLTAAHRTLPFGTRVKVVDTATGRDVTVRINDRGPFVHGRVIDLAQGAARELGMVSRGVANVRIYAAD